MRQYSDPYFSGNTNYKGYVLERSFWELLPPGSPDHTVQQNNQCVAININKPDMVAYDFKPSTQEAEANRPPHELD